MERLSLGPNGGLVYCMEYIEENIDWLQEKVQSFKEHYLVFDTPGQAELYTNHTSVRHIVDHIQRWGVRLCGVHLIDSYYCSVPSTYISAVLLSLSTMLHLELPHINVLSKIDLITKYGKLAFDLEFFAEVGNLDYLLDSLDTDPFGRKFGRLNRALCSLVDDFSLVSFTTLNIQDKESVYELVKMIDKTNGYVYGSFIPGNDAIMTVMESNATSWQYDKYPFPSSPCLFTHICSLADDPFTPIHICLHPRKIRRQCRRRRARHRETNHSRAFIILTIHLNNY